MAPELKDVSIPWWVRLAIGIISLTHPEFAWLGQALQIAYEAWVVIPWFHKPSALLELRKVTKESIEVNHTKPIEQYTDRWRVHAEP